MEQLSTKVLVRASLRPGVTGLPSSVCGVGGRHAWQLHRGLGHGHHQRLGEKSGRPSG